MIDKSRCKLESTLSFRLPEHTKKAFMKLTIEQKHEAEAKLRRVIAMAIHMSKFDEDTYLGEE